MPSVRRALALLLLSSLSTCGGSSNPAAPSGPAQVEGVWTGVSIPTTLNGRYANREMALVFLIVSTWDLALSILSSVE